MTSTPPCSRPRPCAPAWLGRSSSRRTAGAAVWWVVAFALAVLLAAEPARGQNLLEAFGADPGEAEQTPGEPTLAERQADVATRLAELEQRLAEATAADQAPLISQTRSERGLLERVELRLRQLETALAERDEAMEALSSERLALDALLASEPDVDPDADFFALERARDALDAAAKRASQLEHARRGARRQLRAAEESLDRAERAERDARDAVAGAADPSLEAAARQTRRERALQTEAEHELLRVRRVEVESAELGVEAQLLVVDRLRTVAERMAERVTFSEEDFERQSRVLDERLEDLRARARQLETEIDLADSGEASARGAVAPNGTPTENQQREIERYVSSGELAADELAIVQSAETRVAKLRRAWERRKYLSQGEIDAGECVAWELEADEWLEDFDADADVHAQRLQQLREELASARADLSPESTFYERRHVDDLEVAIETVSTGMAEIDSGRRIVERLQSEIAGESRRIPLSDRLRVVQAWAEQLWNYELIPLEERSITVRKVVLGLGIVILGGWLAKRFSRLLSLWLARRFQVDEGGRAVTQTLTFYALVVAFVLFALKVVNVPLTAFTIFGGAIAIGVGFGSQNVINNFISGLILLMEQPVRVGDLIQLGELHGNVQRIGARSTVVRTGSNIEIVVPNSSFLEEQVVNLTLSESRVRVHVRVGVAYGSPTRDVAKCLKRAAVEHGRVLKTPEPIVLFEDFGDDALIFEVHFWIQMRRVMDRRTIESDVRFMIDGLLSEAGVVIAFPQRDVHLDTSRPLEVRVLEPHPAPEEPAPEEEAANS